MNRIRSIFSVYLAIGLVLLGAAVDSQAQTRRNEREVRDIVRSLNSKVDDFQYSLNYRMQSGSANRDDATRVSRDLRSLQDKVRKFQDNLDGRRENADDIRDIMGAARSIDQFLYDNSQNRKIETDWEGIKSLLERLASNYSVYPDWNGGGTTPDNSTTNQLPQNNSPHPDPTPSGRSSTYNNGLGGTYQLDAARSENTADIVAGSGTRNDTQKQELEDRLRAPEQIAIDIRGNQVTLATSNAAPVTFVADGRDKTENVNGRTLRIRATLNGQVLTVSSLGGENDYTVSFTSEGGGRTMKVSRRVTTDYLDQTVFAESVYNKTDSVARLGINQGGSPGPTDNGGYSSNDPGDNNAPNNSGYPTVNTGRRGEYIVPNGTVITGTLENEINTKISQNNDRFRMTVQSPDEFRGATIEGYISGVGRSGKVTGRSNVTLNFERITLRNGQTYDFAGYLQSVKDASGKEVKVDTEGTAKGESQTKETAKRGGIGAGIGAVIGAIAGGVKGAAIGAVIGGGAGAGSVAIQNNGDLQLGKGSTVTVQSSSPKQ
jgi:hypothetical protein